MTVAVNDVYRSVDDADAFFDNRLYATDWTGASADDKSKAMLHVTRLLDLLMYSGYKQPVYDLIEATDGGLDSLTDDQIEAAADTQDHEFPRDDQTTSTVQTVYQYTVNPSSGTYTLTITLNDGTAFTTGNIAYDANAATIETAIDVAATAASVTDWTNGDIAVTGGPLTTAAVVLTFSGGSVSGVAHKTRPVLDGTNLVGATLASPTGQVSISGELPDSAFFALCLEAASLLSGKQPDCHFDALWLTSDGTGVTRASFDRTGSAPAHTANLFTSAEAWGFIQRHLDANNTFIHNRE
jgi:hypothetical protein